MLVRLGTRPQPVDQVPETSALSCARCLYAETPSTTSALATRPIARARRINLGTLAARDPVVNVCLPSAIVACQCARPPVRGVAETSRCLGICAAGAAMIMDQSHVVRKVTRQGGAASVDIYASGLKSITLCTWITASELVKVEFQPNRRRVNPARWSAGHLRQIVRITVGASRFAAAFVFTEGP